MLLGFICSHDVNDIVAFGFQIIGNHRAVALPPQRLGAHDGGAFFAGKFQEALDAFVKFPAHHEIGVTSESLVAPNRVRRIGESFAASAEFWEMDVFDPGIRERFGQIFLAEMRQAT